MRLLILLPALAGCASTGALARIEADVRRLDGEVRRLEAEDHRQEAIRAGLCQRFEEYQRATGKAITHPCRPSSASVDIQPLKVFGEAR